MHFLSLRFDPHAQYEIRVYADVMIEILKKWVPLTYDAFVKNRLSSLTLSSDAIEYIKQKLNRKRASDSSLSKRELQTLKEVFDL